MSFIVEAPTRWDRIRAALAEPGTPSSDFDFMRAALPPEYAGRKPLREAAVLIGLSERQGRMAILLTRRGTGLRHHPGQIAFAGGACDPADESLQACALREAREEVGLTLGAENILGALAPHETVTGFSAYPFVAWVPESFEPRLELGEVAAAFWIPLEHILDIERFRVETGYFRGAQRRYYAVPYGPWYIWGATARMLHNLALAFNHARIRV